MTRNEQAETIPSTIPGKIIASGKQLVLRIVEDQSDSR